MNLAYISTTGQGDTDLVLEKFANTLMADAVKTCGVVQVNSDRENCHKCDMDVIVLPDGPVIRISQSLGKDAKGCRLDPAALEGAVSEVETRLKGDVDILIINKFGKHEAGGRGFRDVIATACERDIPIIVGLSKLNVEAFTEFCGGVAIPVDAEIGALTKWYQNCRVSEAVAG